MSEHDAIVARHNDFIASFASAEFTVMRDFLTEIFKPSRYVERSLLRGVYITSGTQEGTPIDRLMGAMASTFGLNRQSLSAFSGSSRVRK